MKPFLFSNDEAGTYPPSWYASSANTPPQCSPLTSDYQVDVCIVGAGYTGLSSALHLAQKGYKVCVLEAHKIGWGASGRNGGQISMGLNKDQYALEKSYGKNRAHDYWWFASDAVKLVRSLIQEHNIDCDLQSGIIHADHKKNYVASSQAYVEKLQDEYRHGELHFLDKNDLRNLISSEQYYGGYLDLQAAHCHPLNYALGLAHAAQKAGAILHENTVVTHYDTGEPNKVYTQQGDTITADHVILACNGYLDKLNPCIAKRVMPINNFIVATEPMSDQERRDIISKRYAVADSRFVINYYRFSEDNRLLFGGGENYSFKFPNNITEFVRPNLLNVFPQLHNTKLEYGWGGTLAITMKRLPYFNALSPTVYTATGYSGNGIAIATMAGKVIANTISGSSAQFDLMRQIKTHPFPGGTVARYPLMVLAMLYYSLLDRI